MNLTCEQVEKLRKLEDRCELQPLFKQKALFGEFSAYDISSAMVLLFERSYVNSMNLIKKKSIEFKLSKNPVIKYLRKTGNLSYMLDDKLMQSVAKKAEAEPMLCFANSFFMAVGLEKYNIENVKVVAGLATAPLIDETDCTYVKHTFTHAVLQVGDYIYDYNYNIKLKAEQYFEFFAFNIVNEIPSRECLKQFLIMKQAGLSSKKLGKYNDMIYITLANKDAMKRLYNYNVGSSIVVDNKLVD